MQSLTKPAPTIGDYQPGNINDYLDKLEPSKGGKYICPVCGGNDLSISKDGATTCFNNGCEWKSIMDAVAPLPSKMQRDIAYREKWKPPSKKEIDHKAHLASIEIDLKTDEFAYAASYGNIEESRALTDLAAWCKAAGHDKFSASKLFQTKVKEIKAARAAVDPTVKSSKTNRGMTTLQIDAEMIEDEVGHLLRWDSATNNFYLEAKRLVLGRERLILSREYGLPIKIGKEDCMDICVYLALKNEFNSVTDYLDGCRNTQGIRLLDLASIILGTTNELQSVFFRNWLVGAVARAYEPGCQVDEVMILQGKQGQAKSKLFSSLVPKKEWFNGNGLKGNKITDEEIKNAQRVWITEIPEIERIFKKTCSSELKAFVTIRADWMRQLYEKMPELYPRNSVMCGTTNEDELYTDDSGNRRSCMVQVKVPLIDSEWVIAHRDSIWAAARDEYKAGMIWHLTESQKIEHEKQNRQWQIEHPWQGMIEYYLKHETKTCVAELMVNVIKLDMDKLKGRSEQMQIAGILKSLGFKKTGGKVKFMEREAVAWQRDIADETEKGMEV